MAADEGARRREGSGSGGAEAAERQGGEAAQFAGGPGRAFPCRQDCGEGLLEGAPGAQGPPGREPEEEPRHAPRVLCQPTSPTLSRHWSSATFPSTSATSSHCEGSGSRSSQATPSCS